jgi:hypothetical protein
LAAVLVVVGLGGMTIHVQVVAVLVVKSLLVSA